MAVKRSWSRGATRVTTAVALVGIALVALLETRIGSPPVAPAAPALLPPPGDTATVYGPVVLSTPNGNATNHTESFAVSVIPGKRYILRMTNGDVGGGHKVTSGTVRLNGWETITSTELGSGNAIDKVVQARSTDTLFTTVQGGAGAYVTVSVLETGDASFIVLGPEHFVRTTGTPVTELRPFTISSTAAPPYRLCLKNGEDNGANRVSSATILMNHQEVFSPSNFNNQVASLMAQVTLQQANTLSVTLAGQPGGFVDICVTATDTTPPVIANIAPAQNFITHDTLVTVSGKVHDETPTTVTINGQSAPLTGDTAFSQPTLLPVEGHNTIHIVATDRAGHVTDSTRVIIRDRTNPVLTVTAPADGFITKQMSVVVSGTVQDSTLVTVNVNGTQLLVDQGAFSGPIALPLEGLNPLTVTATDAAGNQTAALRTVRRDTIPPVLAVTQPAENDTVTTTSVTVSGTVTDSTLVTLTVNGTGVTVGQGGAYSTSVNLVLGLNTITVVATDQATNSSTVQRHVFRKNPLPPDPATVASVVNRAEVTTIGANTAFLYAGTNPIQTGVDTTKFNPVRAAVLRGRVLNNALQPLGGAVVKILNHSEFGQTLSRADGGYDLAVNGGGQLTVSYTLGGYLPAQRQLDVPWQDYTRVDDVILLRPDTIATVVALTADSPAVARSSSDSDADGSRRATIIFKPGNTATLTVPGQAPVTITTMTVRATEFTVGNNGPLSMPADLPPASQYTYAVQITADTQIAAGPGAKITLAQPVPVYVENFLEVPIGTKVPVGAYNDVTGAWVPKPNGMVLRILSPDAQGLARIDINGDNVADPPSAWAGLGIDNYELKRLAGLYPSGADLWRALAPTFEPLDLNFPFIFVGSTPTDGKVKAGCSSREGDPLRCQLQAQTAFQQVGIVGSPFTLNYASDRTQGNVADRKLDITLTGATLPAQLLRVDFEIDVAGQRFTGSFPQAQLVPNLHYNFTWDGKDLYGRLVQGTQPATVLIGYVFPVQYAAPANAVDAFGLPCAPSGTGTICPFIAQGTVPARAERTLVQRLETSIGTVDAVALGLGGFTLDVQNVYDPVGEILYNGDGTRRAAAALPPGIITVAGKPTGTFSGVVHGVPALNVQLSSPNVVAVGPDGSVYFSERGNMIQKLTPDGLLWTIMGRPLFVGFTGDGGPADTARASSITGLAIGPDNSIYLSDAGNQRIRKINPQGIINTIAGTGTPGPAGDSGQAILAQLNNPQGLDLGPDGSLYIADQSNRKIRRIAPDGIITTVAGTGVQCFTSNPEADCGQGTVATKAKLQAPRDVAVGADGSFYFTDFLVGRVRRVGPDGIIRTFAGAAISQSSGDGGFATLAGVPNPWALALAPDGSLYISQDASGSAPAGSARVRRVASTGIITTFAGTGTGGFSGDGGPAAAAQIEAVTRGIAVGPDGSIYVPGNNRIRKIRGVLPGFGAGQTVIASSDGSDLYVFSPGGRHRFTLRQLTGDTLFRFGYNDNLQLVSVSDRYGLTTQITRDASGSITGVVSPDGYHSSVVIGANGELQSLTDPSGRIAQMAYTGTGLPTTATDPNGFQSTYSVDSLGRLTKVADEGGGFLERNTVGTSTTMTNSSNNLASADATVSATGAVTQTGVLPSGTRMQSTTTQDGVTISRTPDGTTNRISTQPDPRFGMQVPITQVVTTLPSGLQRTERRARVVQLSDPLNLFSLTSQTDSVIRNGRASTQTYDRALRRLTSRTPAGRLLFTFYDSLGSRVRDSVPGFLARRYTYDAGGRLTQISQGTRTVQAFYGGDGLQDSIRDELGRITVLKYDSSGNLVTRVRPGADTVRWQYDSSGNKTAVIPPGRPAHGFAYTLRGAPARYEPPPVVGESSAVVWQYRSDGLLSQVQSPGFIRQTGYDIKGRRSSMVFAGDTISFTYDDSTGQLTRINGLAAEVLTQTYDGMLLKQRAWTGPVSGTVAAVYDSSFNVSSTIVNGSTVANYGFDLDGSIVSAGGLTLTRNASNGLITGTTLGQVTTSVARNAHREDTLVVAQTGSTTLASWTYTRDQSGRIVGVGETINGVSSTIQYGFDSVGRLASVTKDGVINASYEYDRNGNRLRAVYPAGEVGGTYDVQDRILTYGNAQYRQSSAGFPTTKIVGTDSTRYSFDALGELRAVTLPNGSVISFIYDGNGHRVGKLVNGVLVQGFLYSGANHPVAELDGSGAVVRQFVYASRPDVPDFIIQGSTRYRIIADQVGSVRLVVNSETGAIVQRIDYDAFGIVISNSAPGFQPFGFAGGIIDAETGLVQLGMRFYDPSIGRWLSRDPFFFEGGSSNLYSYAESDPINSADHTGAMYIIVIIEMNEEIEKQKKREFKRIERTIEYTAECINGMIDGWFDYPGFKGTAMGAAKCGSNVLEAVAWNTIEDFLGIANVTNPWMQTAYQCMFGVYEDVIYPDVMHRLIGKGGDPDFDDNLTEAAFACAGGAMGQGLELLARSKNRLYGPLIHAYTKILYHTSAKWAEAFLNQDGQKEEPQ